MQRAKDAALAEVRAAEDRANRAHPPLNPNIKVVPMEIPDAPSGKVKGKISQIDCVGRVVRLTVRTPDGKLVRLLVSDAQNLAVLGAGELSLKCGAAPPARTVSIEYQPKANAKLGTAGEVVTVTSE